MIFDRLKDILLQILAVDEDAIVPEALLYDDLNADDAAMEDISLALEDEFGVPALAPADYAQYATVGDLADYVSENLA